jgi:hypothetical protein
MILTPEQIRNIITTNPNKDLVIKAQQNSKKLRMHLYGDGLDGEIKDIDGYEKPELRALRKKYAKSNKDLFARLSRPIDKVFSARGGSVYYNLTDNSNKQAMRLSMNVTGGLSVKKWLEYKWKPHTNDDPNGFIFMEISEDAVPYPTYKSIFSVYDYQVNGSTFDYIVFNVSKEEKLKSGLKEDDKIFRLIDDTNDYWVKVGEESITILESNTFPNYFGYVPAIINSDFDSPQNNGLKLSIFNDVIELADDFLQTGSIRNLAKIRMAYPKYWEYADDCPVCKGERFTDAKPCESCKGTGKKIMLNPGDSKLLTYPDSKDAPMVTPNVAGFVPFPKDYFDYATTELSALENLMSLTIWGTESKKTAQGPAESPADGPKTATQVIDEIQPKADRLTVFSEMAEKRHKFIIDAMISIVIDSSYNGSSVNYGRRYMIEGPDVIWNRYSEARAKGASVSILDDLLMEFIETKYSGDAVSMNIQLKLLAIEPFVHLTISEVKGLNPSPLDYTKKLYFSEWLAGINEAMLLSFSTDELKKQLEDYAKEKVTTAPAPVPDPAKLN